MNASDESVSGTDQSRRERLLGRLDAALAESDSPAGLSQRVLEIVVREFDCPAGTIHLSDDGSQFLELTAHIGIPDVVLEKVQRIPFGKGMAGLAAERRAPVQVCNLQTDDSDVFRPAAKDTKMAGSVAAPMITAGAVRGVLGVAKPVPYEFTDAECELLLAAGALLGKHLRR